MIITFEGYSDDIVYVNRWIKGQRETSEHYVNGAYNGLFQVVTNHGEGCYVRASYEEGGVWAMTAFQLNEGQSLPLGWRISITNNPECNYSLKLQIDCAIDNAVVKQVYP